VVSQGNQERLHQLRTGCNILISSREEKIYRYTPRDNDAVNGSWMCDAGRLNYKWIQREDRLKDVLVRGQKSSWTAALSEIADKLKQAPAGSVAIVASARQTNEELWLLSKLKTKLGALTDSVRASARATSCSSARTRIRTAMARASPA
jgi:NADH-quinone oxidoreductase subunit G